MSGGDVGALFASLFTEWETLQKQLTLFKQRCGWTVRVQYEPCHHASRKLTVADHYAALAAEGNTSAATNGRARTLINLATMYAAIQQHQLAARCRAEATAELASSPSSARALSQAPPQHPPHARQLPQQRSWRAESPRHAVTPRAWVYPGGDSDQLGRQSVGFDSDDDPTHDLPTSPSPSWESVGPLPLPMDGDRDVNELSASSVGSANSLELHAEVLHGGTVLPVGRRPSATHDTSGSEGEASRPPRRGSALLGDGEFDHVQRITAPLSDGGDGADGQLAGPGADPDVLERDSARSPPHSGCGDESLEGTEGRVNSVAGEAAGVGSSVGAHEQRSGQVLRCTTPVVPPTCDGVDATAGSEGGAGGVEAGVGATYGVEQDDGDGLEEGSSDGIGEGSSGDRTEASSQAEVVPLRPHWLDLQNGRAEGGGINGDHGEAEAMATATVARTVVGGAVQHAHTGSSPPQQFGAGSPPSPEAHQAGHGGAGAPPGGLGLTSTIDDDDQFYGEEGSSCDDTNSAQAAGASQFITQPLPSSQSGGGTAGHAQPRADVHGQPGMEGRRSQRGVTFDEQRHPSLAAVPNSLDGQATERPLVTSDPHSVSAHAEVSDVRTMHFNDYGEDSGSDIEVYQPPPVAIGVQ